jgi:hypothetical protein
VELKGDWAGNCDGATGLVDGDGGVVANKVENGVCWDNDDAGDDYLFGVSLVAWSKRAGGGVEAVPFRFLGNLTSFLGVWTIADVMILAT